MVDLSLVPVPEAVVAVRARIRRLEVLQRLVTLELDAARDQLAAAHLSACLDDGPHRSRRSRFRRPPCGTEQGYQWHRYNEPWNWPLPPSDPCSCRRAHRQRANAQAARAV